MRAKTTKGHEVFALQRMEDPKTRQPLWSGKIRMVKDNPYFDEYFDWRRGWNDGLAIEHDMGNLILNGDT